MGRGPAAAPEGMSDASVGNAIRLRNDQRASGHHPAVLHPFHASYAMLHRSIIGGAEDGSAYLRGS